MVFKAVLQSLYVDMMANTPVLVNSLFYLLTLFVTEPHDMCLYPIEYLCDGIVRRIEDGACLIWFYDPIDFDTLNGTFVKLGYLSHTIITLYF